MLEATKARVAPVSSAMLYGRGVFTTVAIYDGKPFLWPNHWRRLKDHAGKLNVDCTGANERSVGDAMTKLDRGQSGEGRTGSCNSVGAQWPRRLENEKGRRSQDRPADHDRRAAEGPGRGNVTGRFTLSYQYVFAAGGNQESQLSGPGAFVGRSADERL